MAGGVTVINPGLAAAMFLTALCGRYFGVGPQPPEEVVAPWSRLARLIHELGPQAGRYDMPDEEAAARVDSVARRVWGRTALEGDQALTSTPWKQSLNRRSGRLPGLPQKGSATRSRIISPCDAGLLSAALEMGLAGLLPRAFPVAWCDRLQPWHVVATPGGSSDEDDALVVVGCELNLPPGLDRILTNQVVWGRLHVPPTAGAAGFAPSDRAAWIRMLEQHGPHALLMLNGRQHRRMVPPELDRPVAEIEQLGIPVRFALILNGRNRAIRRRAWPRRSRSLTSGRKSFVCDITGDEIEPTEAAVLTPWEFRRSPLLPHFRAGGIIAEIRLVTDWSDWVVRRDLLEQPS